jgi:hypothetical protein
VDRGKTASAVPQGEEPVHPVGPSVERSGRSAHFTEDVHREQEPSLWELMLSRENLLAALNRVEVNRGGRHDHGRASAVDRGALA